MFSLIAVCSCSYEGTNTTQCHVKYTRYTRLPKWVAIQQYGVVWMQVWPVGNWLLSSSYMLVIKTTGNFTELQHIQAIQNNIAIICVKKIVWCSISTCIAILCTLAAKLNTSYLYLYTACHCIKYWLRYVSIWNVDKTIEMQSKYYSLLCI